MDRGSKPRGEDASTTVNTYSSNTNDPLSTEEVVIFSSFTEDEEDDLYTPSEDVGGPRFADPSPAPKEDEEVSVEALESGISKFKSVVRFVTHMGNLVPKHHQRRNFNPLDANQ